MKVSVEKKRVIDGIQKAAAIIPAKTGAAFLRSIWIKAENGILSIKSTDGNVEFSGIYAAGIEDAGFIGVQGRTFADLIKQLPDGQISFVTDESTLKVKQKGKNYKFPVNNADYFQEFSPYPDSESVAWDGAELANIIDRVSFCIDSDETKDSLGCLCVQGRKDGRIDICGLNGHQFALWICDKPDLFAKLDGKPLLIQKKFLPFIKKWLKSGPIELNLSDKRLYLKNEDEQLSIPRVDLDYPDYSIFMSKLEDEEKSRLLAFRKEMIDALNRIAIFTSAGNSSVFIDLSEKILNLSAQGQETGSGKEELEVSYDGSIKRIAFPTSNLMEVLNHFESDEIFADMTGEQGVCGIRGLDAEKDGEYVVAIMPMNMGDDSYYEE